MTYIEFFDKTAIENLCACLSMLPDEVILVGDNEKVMKRHIANYEKVFGNRGQEVHFSCRTVSRWETEKVVQVLDEIVNNYEDCVFGITGGDEIVAFALGIVYERNKDKNIQVHKISIQNNTIYDCDMDGKTIDLHTPQLSVEENIQIYGGEIVYSDVNGGKTYLWDLNPAFVKDVQTMWEICKEKPRDWNAQIGVFEVIGEVGTTSEDGLTVTASVGAVKNYYQNHTGKYRIQKGLIKNLLSKGLLKDFDETSETVSITYKNPQVKKCLTQAGQALEMKVYLTAKQLLNEEGAPVYNDVVNGVEIDWDGKYHGDVEGGFDTTNEIDVFLMHNLIPVLVSCKNGDVTADELYKLSTVAERFGGKYAKKVLVASVINELRQSKTLLQRAHDMGIVVITDKDLMNDTKFAKKLKTVWS